MESYTHGVLDLMKKVCFKKTEINFFYEQNNFGYKMFDFK